MIYTAESVSPKHPDKMCDRISDAILDAYLKKDMNSRVAVEVMGGHGKLYITGEVKSSELVTVYEINDIVKRIVGKDIELADINIALQSAEIAQGVDLGGAGDQGIMVGYATNETPEYLPREVQLSRRLNRLLYEKFKTDGKTQVTLETMDGLPVLTSIVASFQNAPKEDIKEVLLQEIPNFEGELHINPCGDWNLGGFDADAGLTGRKLAVDNYGARVPIGGGAFSGKDPSKVDRSAAYMARKIAVDLLKQKGAEEVTVKLAYSIGVAEPVMAIADIDGTIDKVTGYNLSPRGIIEGLDLLKPIYEETAEYGHFGNGFKWDEHV